MPLLSPTAPSSTDDAFAWRTRNIGYLLTAATHRCIADKLRVVHASGFEDVSEAQLALFHHLDIGGDRLTALAARAGLTKQSMIELVDWAEALELVARLPEPDDKRAKIIGFTPRGRRLLAALHRGVIEAEKRMAKTIGGAMLELLRSELGRYGCVAEPRDEAERTGDMVWRINNIGRTLSFAARCFVKDVLADVHARGNRDVTEVMLPLLRNLSLDGSRLTDLAVRAGVTKQSMREMVDRVEALGFIRRAPDPTDKRAKIIQFTPRGLDLLQEMGRGVKHAERQFRAITSGKFADALKKSLANYVHEKRDDA